MDGPVDGFSVETVDGRVVLTLSNRYGEGDVFVFEALDALRIGTALIDHAV